MRDRATISTPRRATGLGWSPTPPPAGRNAGGQVFGQKPSVAPAAVLTAPPLGPGPDQCWLDPGVAVEPVVHAGRLVGASWDDGLARHCTIWGLGPARDDPATATVAAFHALEEILAAQGLTPSDVMRTWWFLDDLLTWYDDFNRIRSAWFRRHGIFDRLVPGSTGIGCGNQTGGPVSLSAWARRPHRPCDATVALASPLQCPALDYRSSFSRAIAFPLPGGGRYLSISGTASIAPDGSSAHVNDFPAQVALTRRVMEAILADNQATWQQACRSLVYLSRAEDLTAWRHLIVHDPSWPPAGILVQATVCRHDLLFEMEVDLCQS